MRLHRSPARISAIALCATLAACPMARKLGPGAEQRAAQPPTARSRPQQRPATSPAPPGAGAALGIPRRADRHELEACKLYAFWLDDIARALPSNRLVLLGRIAPASLSKSARRMLMALKTQPETVADYEKRRAPSRFRCDRLGIQPKVKVELTDSHDDNLEGPNTLPGICELSQVGFDASFTEAVLKVQCSALVDTAGHPVGLLRKTDRGWKVITLIHY